MSNDAQPESETVWGVITSNIRKSVSYVVVAYVCIVNADDICALASDIKSNVITKFQSFKRYFTDSWDEWMIPPPMGMEMTKSVHRRPLRDYVILIFVFLIVHLILLQAIVRYARVYIQAPVQADDPPVSPPKRSRGRGRSKTPRTVRANRKPPRVLREEIEPRTDFERKIHTWGFKIIKKKSPPGRRTTVRFISPEGEEYGGKVAVRQFINQVSDLK